MKRTTGRQWFGEWIKALRIAKGDQAAHIAARMGVSAATVSRRENGFINIDADEIPAILIAYGITRKQMELKLKEMMGKEGMR